MGTMQDAAPADTGSPTATSEMTFSPGRTDTMTEGPVKQEAKSPARDERGRLLPGHTANSNGRPRTGTAIAELVRGFLEGEDPDTKLQRSEAILVILYQKAMAGDVAAIRELLDRGFGKPSQTLDLPDLPNALSALAERVKERGG